MKNIMSGEDNGAIDTTSVEEFHLQDVIRERMAERKLKAEEKRQADLQRIRDMRSTTGIDPLQRFPKEIWINIFNELDPEDRGNVWSVHPLFRDLLERNRFRDILLPQVLSIIQTKYQSLLWLDPEYHHFNEQLRLISKMSRNSFDRCMDNSLIKRIEEQEADSSYYGLDIVNIRFGRADEWMQLKDMLLISFAEEQENPGKSFFPRGLNVSLSERDMVIREDNPFLMDLFKADITELLRKVGSQIWHFRFFLENVESVTFSSSDAHILLQGWVSQMPNLKWIELLIQPSSQLIDENEGNTLLQDHPFPHLAHLERLTFHSSYQHSKETETFHNIYGVILGANQHIKMLDLNYGNEEDDDSDLPHLPAHLTQSLEPKWFTACNESWRFKIRNVLTTLEKIQPVINFNWKLHTLVLSLTSESYDDSIIPVLQLLHKFPTLKTVKFNELEEFPIGDTEKLGYLDLPHLTEFSLEITEPAIDYKSNIHFFFCLHFLSRCKELKKLTWKMNGYNDSRLQEHLKKHENRNFGEMVDFRAGLRNLYESNLWHVFPELESIYVNSRKCREEGEDYCEHEYRREDFERMSVKRFWSSHQCSRYKHLRNSCII